MESLGFPVGLWAVRTGALVRDLQVSAGGGPDVGAIAAAVVGQDPFDGDPGGGVPGCCAGQERRGGVFGLVGQDLGAGEP